MRTARLHIHPPRDSDSNNASRNMINNFPVERFDHRNGLPSLQIHRCVISSDERLWAAAPVGLICYDGVRFHIYGQKHGLQSHGLRTLAIHPIDKTLWIGTDTGVEVLDIQGITPKPVWSNQVGTVNALALQKHKAFIGCSQGLLEWNDKAGFKPVEFPALRNDTIEQLLSAGDGSVWIIGSTSGLSKITHDNQAYDFNAACQSAGKPGILAAGPDGNILIGGGSGITLLNRAGAPLDKRMLSSSVDALLWDRHDIWVSFGGRLATIPFESLSTAEPKTVLTDTKIKHILPDRFDNIWLSTSGMALLRISSFRNTLVEGIPTEAGRILSIFSQGGRRLIGGAEGLVLPSGDVILEGLEIWDVLEGEDGKIWTATDKGLFCTPNPGLSFLYRPNDCPVTRAPCRALAPHNKKIYVSSIRGVAEIGADGVKEILDPQGKGFGYVYSLHVGGQGHLWIATLGQGVFRFDGQKTHSHPVQGMEASSNVYAISHDLSGRKYFSHNNRITRENLDHSFTTLWESENPVAAWSIGWVPDGSLAAGTSSGLVLLDAETGRIQRRISGLFEDVPWEFTTSRSLAVIDSATLLCGLGAGLRTVQIDNLLPRNDAPLAGIGGIDWRGVTPEFENGMTIVRAGNWHLKIDLSTQWFLDECRMKYKLDGFDSDWSDFSKIGPIKYTSLPPGTYELRAVLSSALAGEGPETRLFKLQVIP